ncbi:MAG: DUF1570 domain-containing protein [Planctomycetota bacterium]|nr:DUF1570 domain-containing protein [Planctomycetota bacterium]MDA1250179.1 DUF1570 domain-containing protein [Planctomycetota bacterium]
MTTRQTAGWAERSEPHRCCPKLRDQWGSLRSTHSAVMFAAVVLLVSAVLALAPNATAQDTPATPLPTSDPLVRVRLRDAADQETTVDGRLLVRAKDGGLLVEARSGRLWTVTPDRLVEETAVEGKLFSPLTKEELGEHLIEELREAGNKSDFLIHTTDHYVVCTDTSQAYAEWCGGLLERLHKAFGVFWTARDLEVREPEFPLPVVILKTQTEFAELAAFDRTPGSAKGAGYFLITGNRIVLYDLTATEQQTPAKTVSDVFRRVQSVPGSVATVVHEATHQIAFNSGLHTRYADNPIWMTEGMAMYFETPDLKSQRGWQTIGRLNRHRKSQFLDFVAKRRKADSLESLIGSDARFREPDTQLDAYGEAWALSYFLIRTKPRQYSAWLKLIAEKPPLQFDSPEERLSLFLSEFGDDLPGLDKQMLAWIRRQR